MNDSKRGTILFAIGILAITIAAMKLYLGLDITKIAYHSNFWALLSIVKKDFGSSAYLTIDVCVGDDFGFHVGTNSWGTIRNWRS